MSTMSSNSVNRSLLTLSVKACGFFVVSVCLHCSLFVAVFDIYFPPRVRLDITNSFRPSLHQPPAKRLVLIVSDGLNAESLFGSGMSATSHLREVVTSRGAWGVSHSAIPTETRYGHVAILAGVEEGSSSALTRFEREAVRFDHIFNRSSSTFAWGRKELLNFFQIPDRVSAVTISSVIENFYEDYFILQWFRNEMISFLSNASLAEKEKLRSQDGLIFFLHISATDIAGQNYGLQGARFQETLYMVDATLARLEAAFARFFDYDNRTAFLFTSDHGKTDAAGRMAETKTPLLAWGAGVRGPLPGPEGGRTDVAQIDLCPLMAALLGLEVPTSNQGRLPVGLLNVSASDTVAMMVANTRQIVELFRRGWTERRQRALVFLEAARLTPEDAERRLKAAEDALRLNETAWASAKLDALAQDALKEVEFFQHSGRALHILCVTAIFVLWSLSLVLSLLPPSRSEETELKTKEGLFFFFLVISQFLTLLIEQRPFLHWFYRLTPIFLIWACWRHRTRFSEAACFSRTAQRLLCIFVGLEIIAFGFFQRFFFSLALVLNTAWQVKTVDPKMKSKAGLGFVTSALALSIFPCLPASSRTRYVNSMLVAAGTLATVILSAALLYMRNKKVRLSILLRLSFASLLLLTIYAAVKHHLNHNTMTIANPAACRCTMIFAVLVCCAICYFSSSPFAVLSVWLTATIVHSFLSINYEALFLFFLFINLSTWVAMETEFLERKFQGPRSTSIFVFRPNISSDKTSDFPDIRICFTFQLFLYVSFFATENIYSISSLHPESAINMSWFTADVIIPVFLLKIFIPLFLTTCLFSLIVAYVEIITITKICIIFGNFHAVQFFFLIQDDGNWNDIGNYAICLMLGLVTAPLLALVKLLLGRSFRTSCDAKSNLLS